LLGRCCLPNDEGPGPPRYFFLEPPLLSVRHVSPRPFSVRHAQSRQILQISKHRFHRRHQFLRGRNWRAQSRKHFSTLYRLVGTFRQSRPHQLRSGCGQ